MSIRNLPEDFKEKYKKLMDENEYKLFINSLENGQPQKGIRVNTKKINIDDFKKITDLDLIENPYSEDGFILSKNDDCDDIKIGKTFLHQCGLIYSQEPSAMSVVSSVSLKDDYKVLDLCAAPGGKSTQIASKLSENGLLVSNEIIYKRAKILVSNIERLGISNCLVINNTPEEIAENYKKTFDIVLIDSPCSGEGMMRKEENAITEWSIDNVNMCNLRSSNILENGAKTVKDGGIIVYSTCTFSYEENEKIIYDFLKNHPDFQLIDVEDKVKNNTADGRPQWLEKEIKLADFYKNELKKIRRIFPHINKGEGHTISVLKNNNQKADYNNTLNEPKLYNKVYKELNREQLKQWNELNQSMFIKPLDGIFVLFGNRIVLLPKIGVNVNNVNILKYGIDVAAFEKNRIEPLHNLATSAEFINIKNIVNLKKDSDDLKKYLSGQELDLSFNFTCWGIVCVENYPLGLIKCSQDGSGKNHYPKGLRI